MATFKIMGSDDEMAVIITINGKELSREQVGQLYNNCDDIEEFISLEKILDKADQLLRDAQYSARHQRVSAFYRDNPDYECEPDPVIRNW